MVGGGATTAYCVDGLDRLTATIATAAPSCPGAGDGAVRINGGGPVAFDAAGHGWEADRGACGGGTYTTTNPIANSADPALYKTARANPGAFTTSLLKGTYTVTLKFVDMWRTAPEQRLFHVAVQGATVLSNFAVLAAAGRQYAAVDRSFTATVTDGTLTVGFTPVVDSAIVSAIEVLPADPPSWASASAVYRGDGLRASRAAGAATTAYAWDVGAGLPVVLQDGANRYVYGAGGALISQTDAAGAQSYALADGLGSTRALTDGSGTVTATYAYDAFAALRASTGTGAREFRFAGQQDDAACGYQYRRARYDDPTTGRTGRPRARSRMCTSRSAACSSPGGRSVGILVASIAPLRRRRPRTVLSSSALKPCWSGREQHPHDRRIVGSLQYLEPDPPLAPRRNKHGSEID